MNFDNSKKYREEIHKIIPGGCHTYSKGDDTFPEKSPAAIKSGKGVFVTDIDGNKFLDCSMGLTSVGLGHAYEPVIKAVSNELNYGVNFQRPSYLEKEVAELFLGLIPQHDMIKFAKNGSSVTTAAVKLARAHTGRKLIAFPHDHPFFSYDDWFIGTTDCDLGVPEEVKNLSVTYKSCDLSSLKQLFEKYPGQIAGVICEPEKPHCGTSCGCSLSIENYLKETISFVKSQGAIFILDEMITGFKIDLPGAISKYDLNPDLATWGKGIANGFSFCALTGKKEIMELGGINNPGKEKLFLISTTHGGETTSIAAAISTINEYKNLNPIKHNHKIGKAIINRCNHLLKEMRLNNFIILIAKPWMITFTFSDSNYKPSLEFKSLFLQEMIANGVLFQGIFVPSFSHSNHDVELFIEAFKLSCEVYKEALENGINNYLIGEPVKPVFRKYQ